MDDISEQSQLPNEHGDDAKHRALCIPDGANFDEWTSLIAETEKISPVDIEKISQVYDSFLSEFPLCYGYWRKYAGHKARFCTVDKVVDVYERAVQSATYSVDLWVDYCSFGMLLFEDRANVQRLFERGISFVGKDYLCNLLWDKYIEFEYSQKKWSSLAHIYIRTLRYPTKKLRSYYDSFKKLAAIWEEEMKVQSNDAAEVQSDATPDAKIAHVNVYDDADITFVIKDLLDPAVGLHRLNALQKYLSTGEQFYQKASELDAKICVFESRIRRPYFHVKPLDVSQLENWHQYLDFAEMHGDFDWTVRLHERCLIPCANYPEFWMRYTEYMETKGGREIANLALIRATQIFLKRVPAIHLFCARFKEKIGDIFGSRAAFRQCDSELDANLIENIRREANMEKRQGDLEAAFRIYEEALQMSIQKQKPDIFSMLSVHFSRYKYMVTGNMDAARDVLIKGIQHLPHCKLLIQELLKFEMMYKGPKQMNFVDSVVTQAICPGPDVSQGLSNKDREDISSLYLEFLDHCGTIHDVTKAWNRHRKLFPHLMRPNLYDHAAGRQDIVITLPHHVSGGEKRHGSVQVLQLEQKSPQPENPNIQPDYAPTAQSQEKLQPLASPKAVEQSRQDVSKQNVEAEVVNDCQVLPTAQEYPQEVSKVQKKPDYDSNDDLRPPSLAALSLSPQNDGTQDSNPTTSHDCGTLQTTPRSNRSRQHDGDFTNEISSFSSLTCTKSGSQSHVQSDYDVSHIPNDPSSLEMHRHPQPVLPTSSASSRNVANEEKRHRRNYTGKALGDASTGVAVSPDTLHPRQVQRSSQPQYQSPSMHPQNFGSQNFPCQPQTWQNPPFQPSTQPLNQHQVVAAQVQPIGAYQWPAQNMQQQCFAPAPQPQPQPQLQPQPASQPVVYPQAQAYQYPVQNHVHYGHMPGNQAFTPQMWHSYYQQQQQQPQQFTTLQTWNNNYYPQQPPVQHYGSSQYGQEYGQQSVQPQVQVTTQQNTEASGPSVSPHPQQTPPSN